MKLTFDLETDHEDLLQYVEDGIKTAVTTLVQQKLEDIVVAAVCTTCSVSRMDELIRVIITTEIQRSVTNTLKDWSIISYMCTAIQSEAEKAVRGPVTEELKKVDIAKIISNRLSKLKLVAE